MKTIVIVSGTRIAPAETGGQVHSLSIARALARLGYRVQIFSIAGRREDYRPGARLLKCELEPGLTEFTHVGIVLGFIQSTIRRLEYPRVWQQAVMRRGFVPRALKEMLVTADVIISDFSYCPPIPGEWRRKPWFLISHNLEHKLLQEGTRRERACADLVYRLESSAPRMFTDIFACAEEDQAFYRTHDPSRQLGVPIIRCGVDPEPYRAVAGRRVEMRAKLGLAENDVALLFSGSGFSPNVEAFERIKIFCRENAEFLARQRVFFVVAGSVSPQPLREGALIATGRVAEVQPYFAAVDAGINLVTRGSGSNVKLFEYLAARLPVLSTEFGVRGTGLRADIDYLRCDIPNLCQTIERFLRSDRTHWLDQAEAVWQRHRRTCDIQCLVQDAIAGLPAFH